MDADTAYSEFGFPVWVGLASFLNKKLICKFLTQATSKDCVEVKNIVADSEMRKDWNRYMPSPPHAQKFLQSLQSG